ncbi:nucleoside hydrolase [Actinopolymorpha alba]|uniref:nucleoside hydrolase n=1 Tax=Actinopolymorpha alba TaxID=533267 RepID=UPI000381A220|nr:nucleoside hydrolase [Actinopolymorpha alba]
MVARHQVIFDTDIGSDVDDALALAMLFGSPEVDLLGVTTVYGDTAVRARIARRLARLAGRNGLAVVPGAEQTLSGEQVWWAGFEGRLYGDLEGEAIMDGTSAARFLVDTTAARPGEVDVVAVGPLTNIAEAIRADAGFARAVRRLYVMGGRFDRPDAEHNFKSDAVATAEVFRSGIPVTVVGLEITTLARIEPDHLTRIGAAGALGRQLEAEVRQWWGYTGTPWNHPHDPLAVLAMVRPDLVGTRPAQIRIDLNGEHPGVSTATDDPESTSYVVNALDIAAAVDETVSRIEAAGHSGPS